MYKFICLLLCHICISTLNPPSRILKKETLSGKVVAITDGDTFRFLKSDTTQIKIRVANIDCPERKQPFSKKAKAFTAQAVLGKTVTLKILKRDRYGRYISNVIYDDSLYLSRELVKHGLAWHYVKYSKDSTLQHFENNARTHRIGLWQDLNAIAPWLWRTKKTKP